MSRTLHIACQGSAVESERNVRRLRGSNAIRRLANHSDVTVRQADLFSPQSLLPEGFRYEEAFLDVREEQSLLASLAALPLQEAQYKEWTAKRRIVSYGGRYDFSRNQLLPEQPIPPYLWSLQQKAAQWLGIGAEALATCARG